MKTPEELEKDQLKLNLMWLGLLVIQLSLSIFLHDNPFVVIRGLFIGIAVATIFWCSVHNKWAVKDLKFRRDVLESIERDILAQAEVKQLH